MNPAGVVRRDAAAWNNTVDVWMKQQVLPPRVQDAKETNLCAKMFRVSSDLEKRLRHRAKQEVIEFDLILQDQRVQFMRQSEHDMKISRRQQFLLSGSDPTLTRLRLTFWTVAITARVIRDGLVATASRAGIDMTAKSRCAATYNGLHHLQLLKTDSALMTVDEVAALRAKDVGHLHGGPGHGFWFLLDRFTVSSLEIEMVSTGLTTACK